MLKKSPRKDRCCRPQTSRIRVELLWGALSLRELATRCGLTGPDATEKLIPYVWQMERRTKEIVKIPGRPNKYRLASQHTELSESWK